MKNPTSRWWALAAVLVLAGCGAEPADPGDMAAGSGGPSGPTSGPGGGASGDGGGGGVPAACEPGETRACEIPVGTQNGVLTCVAGQEECSAEGGWGPCEGTIFARSAAGLPDGLRGDELRDPAVIDAWLASRLADGASGPAGPPGGRFPGDDDAVFRAQTDSESCASPCDPDCQAFPNPLDPTEPDSDVVDAPNGATLLEFLDAVANGHLSKLFPDSTSCDLGDPEDCNVDTFCSGLGIPAASDGCVSWPNGLFNPLANGVDFTLGAGCGDVGSQIVPVCNRGNTAYAGPVTVWIFAANAPEIASCSVPSNKGPQSECTFNVDLAPGQCEILPSSCWAGVTGNNKSLWVNPRRDAPNTVTPIPEAAGGYACNNWSYWDKQANCGACTDTWEAELDRDDEDGSYCGVYFDMDVDILSDERMISIQYQGSGGDPWEPVTWVWNDRWDEENRWEDDGCSGGEQAFIYQHTLSGDLHYHVRLCDELCDRAVEDGEDGDPRVRFTYDCPRQFEPEHVGTIVYQGICPPAKRVQWGYLGFNGVTPGNSSIDFAVRSGTTDPPDDGDWVDLVRARDDASGNDVPPACLLTDPDDECPIDLYAAFDGAPGATQEFLEVQYTLRASTDRAVAPRLYEVYATFTCPDSE